MRLQSKAFPWGRHCQSPPPVQFSQKTKTEGRQGQIQREPANAGKRRRPCEQDQQMEAGTALPSRRLGGRGKEIGSGPSRARRRGREEGGRHSRARPCHRSETLDWITKTLPSPEEVKKEKVKPNYLQGSSNKLMPQRLQQKTAIMSGGLF